MKPGHWHVEEAEQRGFPHKPECATHEGRDCDCYISFLNMEPLSDAELQRTAELGKRFGW